MKLQSSQFPIPLADKTENYSIPEFVLEPVDKQTLLTLTHHKVPTETIHKNLQFYWRGSVERIKKRVEEEREIV